jgi:hypothetical protein
MSLVMPLRWTALLLASAGIALAQPIEENSALCWKALGEGIEASPSPGVPLTLASGGQAVWLAWHENESNHLRRWDGSRWHTHSGPMTERHSRNPLLRTNPAGDVYLAWNANCRLQVAVMQTDRDEWQLLDNPPGAPDSCSGDTALEIDSAGKPVLAWVTGAGRKRTLHVARWNGLRWSSLGAPLKSASDVYTLEPALALQDANVWLTWSAGSAAKSHVRVARWNGKVWSDVGNTQSGQLRRKADVRNSQPLALANSHALVSWRDVDRKKNALAMARWDGKRWQTATPPDYAGEPTGIHMLMDAQSRPLLAWEGKDTGLNGGLHMQRLDAQSWSPLISNMSLSALPSFIFNAAWSISTNGLHLAWEEDGDNRRIHAIHARSCAAGEIAATPPVRPSRQSLWPKTVDEAADALLAKLDDASKEKVRQTAKGDLIQFHFGWGMGIRNYFGMWMGNEALLKSCGDGKVIHPDTCSSVVIARVWERLQASPR